MLYHTYTIVSKLLTVTITNPVHDTLHRYMRALNTDVPTHMRFTKSGFVNECIAARLTELNIEIRPDIVLDEPLPTQYPPVKKSTLPPL